MKKICLVILVLGLVLLIANPIFAQEKRTRQYTPVVKQATYATESPQTNTTIWGEPSIFESIVCDSFIFSSNNDVIVTLAASSTIVKLHVGASRPVVSPGAFLWKGAKSEILNINTESKSGMGEVTVTLTGWEETN